MVSVLITFSRITILIFVMVFTLLDVIQIFEAKIGEDLSGIFSTIQSIMVVFFLINGSIILYYVKEDPRIILLTIFQLVLFVAISISMTKLNYGKSGALLNNMLMLLSFSFIALERLDMSRATRQFVFAIASAGIAILAMLILKNIKHINRKLFIFALVGIALLLIVHFTGKVEYGAKLSLSFGSISIQPSEFVKLTYLFFISGCIVTYKDMRGFLFSTIGAALHVLVLVFSKDLGTAMIFLVAYVFIIFIAYKNYIVLSLEFIVAFAGGIFAYNRFPHIQSRFIAWSDPLSVIDDKGYQITQSLFAIGSGGWFGSGLTNGQPNKIPVVTKDFIFAAISEELGAVVAICLIVIVMCTSIMLFNRAFACSSSFYMLVINGIAIIFSIQAILNIGGVIKFIPSTGVTLPFISYGGSSLLSMFICFYIAQCSDELIYINKGRRRYD
ncbi:cell division protein FtsW, lipid II flippase [Pseudobutyrivibrio ruminis]|uniref:Cell division protein FtsW, lipid II flippase n=1 Tax=Pseudobutyrivibrio ruminis TaxID=46206 RepID=A0A1H7FW28_9FIRM|nr:FtsW/RodA/SpoVE family cell cycle protein [Pseudobutyrivibrio ruminis]SEK28692.1 cell division protein FtsW, lipid II flippase [Pseudobutyrivibrio ruminis]